MQYFIPKKLMVINDMAGFGRCSMTVALPVISACKVQACPVPTSIFSNHTGFPTFHMTDLTSSMDTYLSHFDLAVSMIDGIYCGYLGSIQQMEIIEQYLQKKGSQRPPLILIDPVMGDHGKPYTRITNEYCTAMKLFIRNATVITPNVTEACILSDTPYKANGFSIDELKLICERLSALGPQQIIITGVPNGDTLHNFVFLKHPSIEVHDTFTPITGPSRNGTGDIFASIISALSLRDYSLLDATRIASQFIANCIKETAKVELPPKEGVILECLLGELMNL